MVFSTGPADARVMLVGAQPGDQEDRRGAPFVGAAGQLLARATDDAGMDRADLYGLVRDLRVVATNLDG